MSDYKKQLDSFVEKINACEEYIQYEIYFFPIHKKSKYFEIAQNTNLYRSLYFKNLDTIKEHLSYNLASYVWKLLISNQIEINYVYSFTSYIVDTVESYSQIVSWFDFPPFDTEFEKLDIYGITGLGYLFKLANEEYFFFIISGTD